MTAQRVIITAGGNGIGRIMAQNYANNGAKVHVCDIDEQALSALAEDSPEITVSTLDVTDEDALEAYIDQAIDHMDGVDVLINNAGIAGPVALVEELDLDQWRECFAVNLEATMLTCKRTIPVMKDQQSGAIINISSTSGLYGVPARSAYAASKWAVIGFTKSLAIEVGKYGIRANCICPGSVAGDRIDRIISAEAAATGRREADLHDDYNKGVSMGRFVSPQEIADLCLYLTSPAATMISGQAIAIDGNTETFHAE